MVHQLPLGYRTSHGVPKGGGRRVDHRGQGQPHSAPNGCPAFAGEAKKNETPIIDAIDRLLADSNIPDRHRERLRRHVISQLVGFGQKTITGLLTTSGRQSSDWSADYRLYAEERINPVELFAAVRRTLVDSLPQGEPVVAAMDDTQIRHTGRKIPGVKYRRDPLGPAFRVNFILAQRFVQISLARDALGGQARMVPVDFTHAPTPQKPRKNDTEKQWKAYNEAAKACRLTAVGLKRLCVLREQLDADGQHDRDLWISVDGSYTNGRVLKHLPKRTTVVGRIRNDAKLYDLPEPTHRRGRRRVYGQELPTPEALRQDPNIPWLDVKAFAAGGEHTFRIKSIRPVRWRAAGGNLTLQLIIIAPLRYRKSRNSKLLYRKATYLICTDPEATVEQILRTYIARWEIEVNFREEKSLVGVGQAQVRHPVSTEAVPAMAAASYSMLLTAAGEVVGRTFADEALPSPKWRDSSPLRASTQTLINHLRHELWRPALNITHFATCHHPQTKSQKIALQLNSAIYYSVASG